MKKIGLKDVLEIIGVKDNLLSLKDKKFTGLEIFSKNVKKGNIFVCLKGTNEDGHKYIDEAIKKGANLIIGEKNIKLLNKDVLYLKVKDSKKILNELLNKMYNDDLQKAFIIGITGSKGKTTISYLIDAILKEEFKKENTVLGTIRYKIGKKIYPANTTTPSIIQINKFISESIKNRINNIIMEISSHALDQGRADNLKLDRALITNITRDHLDYHKTFSAYFAAKLKILKLVKSTGKVIINLDDKHSDLILKKIKSQKLSYVGVSYKKANAFVKLIKYETDLNGSKFLLKVNKKKIYLDTPLIGLHNIYNIMLSIGALYDYVKLNSIKKAIKNFEKVDGRLEKIYSKDFFVFVDYAHTPDSMEKVLLTLNSLKKNRIITVFGAGGNRDKGKRPLMGKVANKYSDVMIVTSDNPRFEKPEEIIKDIMKGIKNKKKVIIKIDRKEAIKFAINIAEKNDIVIIMGKGHENYQIIKDKKIYFNDGKVALSEIKKREKWNYI